MQVKMVLHIRTWEVVRACRFLLTPCSFLFLLHSKSEPGRLSLAPIPLSELLIYLFFPSHLLSSPPHSPPSLFFLLTAAGLGHSVWARSFSPLWGFSHLLFFSVSFLTLCRVRSYPALSHYLPLSPPFSLYSQCPFSLFLDFWSLSL